MQHESGEVREARTRSIFRELNERIPEVMASNALGELTQVLCECGDRDCTQVIAMTIEEHECFRLIPTRFVVIPGHVTGSRERVISVNDRYAIVEELRPPEMFSGIVGLNEDATSANGI